MAFTKPPPPPSSEELRLHGLPLLRQAAIHAQDHDRILLSGWPQNDGSTDTISYRQVLSRAAQVADLLLARCSEAPGNEPRLVAHLTVPGWEYVSALWGAWGGGFGSVPLALSQKSPELQHVLTDAQPQVIFVGGGVVSGGSHPTHVPENETELLRAAELAGMSDRIVRLKEVFVDETKLPPRLGNEGIVPHLDSPALLLYTSGTTGRPKGVLTTHRNVYHQVTDLVHAWKWQPTDVALHVLPLHHVHGIINLLSCAAYAGARLEFRPFNTESLWKQWALPSRDLPSPTVFMAVPTIYAKLLEASEQLTQDVVETAVQSTLEPMRLMVSGSAALPVSILERWRNMTSHTLLERYGMTEFAMALSNSYDPPSLRQPGHVGVPLPSVEVRIVDEATDMVVESGVSGSLQVRGPTVFREYLNRPDATEEAFTKDGFFRTGDVAEFNTELQSYRILGRASVDIMKVGGYKLSALEIERIILEHPDVAELAVLGVPDEIWGERVGMLCRMKSGHSDMTLDVLRDWCEDRMARYKVPSRLVIVDSIPKNAMGKVNKRSLVELFRTEQ